MNTKIYLNEELSKKVDTGYLTCRELVSFLLNKGFSTDKKNINNTALRDLKKDNKSIYYAEIKRQSFDESASITLRYV